MPTCTKKSNGRGIEHKNLGALVPVHVKCYNDGNGSAHIETKVWVSKEDHAKKKYPRKICASCRHRTTEVDTSTEHRVAI